MRKLIIVLHKTYYVNVCPSHQDRACIKSCHCSLAHCRFVPPEKMNQRCEPTIRENCTMVMKTECSEVCREECEDKDKKVCMTIPHQVWKQLFCYIPKPRTFIRVWSPDGAARIFSFLLFRGMF